jgi:aminoglycoside 6'-N-acetyltransferase
MDGTDTVAAPDPLASEGDLSLRRLRDDPADFALIVRWRAMPHVHEWWDPDDPAPDLNEVLKHYRPTTDPAHPTTGCVIELAGRPIGYLQFYRWGDWIPDPEGGESMDVPLEDDPWGLDLYIGEPEMVNRGLGTRAVALACRHLHDGSGVSTVMLTTEIGNLRAQAAYRRAGFKTVRRVLDTDTRDGERIWTGLMRWDAPAGAAD